MVFMADYEGETNADAAAARKHLKETGDFKAALTEFPKYLRLERSMLDHLNKSSRDYANALRKLPRHILLLFVHAFQSHLFNTLLSERISEGKLQLEGGEYYCSENLGFPSIEKKSNKKTRWIAGKLIGYETKLNDREKELFMQLGIKPADFNVKSLPEISSKGTHRVLLSPLKDFSFKDDAFRFSLQSGSYATTALREFIDKEKGRNKKKTNGNNRGKE
jgi:tRNA pseudouridine13 synthase